MKAASVSEIKKDLSALSQKEVIELCMRLARFKKENKELLTYILYESTDEENFITSLKEEVDEQFEQVNHTSMYYAKKSFRKILRFINKHTRYSGIKTTEIDLLIYYCNKLKSSKSPIKKSNQMMNLYQRQLDKIEKLVAGLHEDLQYDYKEAIEGLEL